MKFLYRSVMVFSSFLLITPAFAQTPRRPVGQSEDSSQSVAQQQAHEREMGEYHPKGLKAGDRVVVIHTVTARFQDDAPSHRHVRTLRRGQKLTVLGFTKPPGIWGLLPSGSMRKVWVSLEYIAPEHRSAH